MRHAWKKIKNPTQRIRRISGLDSAHPETEFGHWQISNSEMGHFL
jgi:hypothetical protein